MAGEASGQQQGSGSGSGSGDRVALVTGANRGIGLEVARGLASTGMTVVLACRDAGKADAAARALRSSTGNERIETLTVDLADQRSIRAAADAFRERFDRLHVLVNNAGLVSRGYEKTTDGIERCFAVNHLAPFLWTNLLLKHIEASGPARILTVSSEAHRRADDPNEPAEQGYDPLDAYCRSKLANIYFTNQLAQRLLGTSVTANAVHPGTLKTGMIDDVLANRWWLGLIGLVAKPFLAGPEKGGEALCALATEDRFASFNGKYFKGTQEVQSSPVSYDEIIGNQLWERSLELTSRSR